MWPTFTITELHADGSPIGSVDFVMVGQETWVGERYLGYLKTAGALLAGRWHAHGCSWRFAPAGSTSFSLGETFSVLDGYWCERVSVPDFTIVGLTLVKFGLGDADGGVQIVVGQHRIQNFVTLPLT